MNDGLIKVEICIVNGDWQWTGKLSTENLKQLCNMADKLSDASYYTDKKTPEKTPVICTRCLWLSKTYRHCENCGKRIYAKESAE